MRFLPVGMSTLDLVLVLIAALLGVYGRRTRAYAQGQERSNRPDNHLPSNHHHDSPLLSRLDHGHKWRVVDARGDSRKSGIRLADLFGAVIVQPLHRISYCRDHCSVRHEDPYRRLT